MFGCWATASFHVATLVTLYREELSWHISLMSYVRSRKICNYASNHGHTTLPDAQKEILFVGNTSAPRPGTLNAPRDGRKTSRGCSISIRRLAFPALAWHKLSFAKLGMLSMAHVPPHDS